MISIRLLSADDWRAWRQMRLEALREAPYAYSSSPSEWQGENDIESRWRGRLTDVPFNVIAYLDVKAGGIVSATSPSADGAVKLISMWVAPFARGAGVGDALIEAVAEWARALHAHRVLLDVYPSNSLAVALYRRNGFIDDGVADGELRMCRTLKR